MTPPIRPFGGHRPVGIPYAAFATLTHRVWISCALCVSRYWEESFVGDERQATRAGYAVYQRLTDHVRSTGQVLTEDEYAVARWAVSQGAVKSKYCSCCDAYHFVLASRDALGCPYCTLGERRLLPSQVRGYIESARPTPAVHPVARRAGCAVVGDASGHFGMHLPVHCAGA